MTAARNAADAIAHHVTLEIEALDLVTFRKGERKDDRTQDFLRRWPGGEGLLYIGKSQEKSRVPHTRRETDPVTGFRRASLYFSTAMVNNYYFYFVVEDFGPCFLKFCS